MGNIRVVVANPGEEAEVRMISEDEITALVGGYLECLPLWCGYDMWINEEGKLLGLPPNRLVAAAGKGAWDVVGPLVVAASHNGETISLSEQHASDIVHILNGATEFCRALKAEEVEVPGFTITEWKG